MRIMEEAHCIEILDCARKSAKKHDFRNFCSGVYNAIMGLEQTELELILLERSEIERQETFYMKHRGEIARETSATIKSYARERIFTIPALGPQLFEWHIKLDGNRTRIHYWIDKTERKVYIGHCGKHLPVVG